MKTARKLRIYPNQDQKILFAKTFGCCRFSYNTILAWRKKEYEENKTYIGLKEASKKLTSLKQEFAFLGEVSSVALQQSIRIQQTAYCNFFENRAKFPQFRKKHGNQSFQLTKNGFSLDGNKLILAKCSAAISLDLRKREIVSPSSLTISLDRSGRYFVSFVCEDVEEKQAHKTGEVMGIDLGLSHFCITSNGKKVPNPRFLQKNEQRLKTLSRRFSKKKKGSSNFKKAKKILAKQHAKVVDARRDFHHKLSTRLVNENQVICLETLSIKGLLKGKWMSKSISDAAWGQFCSFLDYKVSRFHGSCVLYVKRNFPSSQICSCCQTRSGKKPLHIRVWQCSSCGTTHDRDVNAAKNVLTAGLAGIACGACSSGDSNRKEVV